MASDLRFHIKDLGCDPCDLRHGWPALGHRELGTYSLSLPRAGAYSVAQQAILDRWDRRDVRAFLTEPCRKFTWDLKAKMMGKKAPGVKSRAHRHRLCRWLKSRVTQAVSCRRHLDQVTNRSRADS